MLDEDILVFGPVGRRLPRRDLRRFACTLQERVAGGVPFCCRVTADSELRGLNRRYLGKDYPTDVLSFPAEPGSGFIGDIAISADRAADQAREHRHSTADEVRLLMLHGVLHLLGYDHETDHGRMARAERRWRGKLGLPHGLIERGPK